MPGHGRSRLLPTCLLALGVLTIVPEARTPDDGLRQALTFHAPFDAGTDAVHAGGDARIHWAPTMAARVKAQPGLPEGVELAADAGRFGGALRFTRKQRPVAFYRAAGNMPYDADDWSGTVSFWLGADLDALEPGFCDPIQITSRAWNDAAFFVEFEKRPPSIPFRLGVYADHDVWNPQKRKFEDIPPAERPLVTVDDPPFGPGRWTHVAFTFERFNTGRADGVARLYLDGQPRGTLGARNQRFTWTPDEAVIALGLSYIGLVDDLAIFDRALSEDEVRALHALETGVAALRP